MEFMQRTRNTARESSSFPNPCQLGRIKLEAAAAIPLSGLRIGAQIIVVVLMFDQLQHLRSGWVENTNKLADLYVVWELPRHGHPGTMAVSPRDLKDLLPSTARVSLLSSGLRVKSLLKASIPGWTVRTQFRY